MNILYVEDDAVDADLARRALALHLPQARLQVANTLVQARECLRLDGPFALLLVDICLPDGNGLDLVREVREQGLPLAVVALTGQGDETLAIAALKAGADDYLAKGAQTLERLASTARAALQRFAQSRTLQRRGLRVLYAEHERVDIDLTRRHLERHAPHIAVEVVGDGAAVLDRLPQRADEACAFDVLLLDFRLGDLNALELLKCLREERGLDIAVVLVTGQGGVDVATEAMRFGATDYLVKHSGYLHGLPQALESAFHRVNMERERAKLRQSEERLNLVLRGSNDAMWDVDLIAGTAYFSPRWWAMLGLSEVADSDEAPLQLQRMHADDRPLMAERLRAILAGSADSYELEFRLMHRDGHAVSVLSRGHVLRDAQQRARRISGTNTDLSERRLAQRALRELNGQLERMVGERTAELAQARDEAMRANRAKSDFLSSMSHELRTPMNAVLGFSQLLAIDNAQPLTARQLAFVHNISRAGEHLMQLINEVLDLARVEAGVMPIQLEAVDLLALIDECLSLVAPLAQQRGVRLVPGVSDARLGHVKADAVRVKQVLINLLGNAIKYNRPGGSVAVHLLGAQDATRVEVRDNGPGLSAEHCARLFQKFERLDADASGAPGAGIGLALSKRLVELMGGAIGVHSELGNGSIFWFELAASAAAADRRAQVPQPALELSALGGARRVVYIEDDLVNQALMQALLGLLPGVELTCFDRPEPGLAQIRAQPPDLVLLDIELPGMSGYEVLKALRSQPGTRGLQVIAVSAQARPADIAQGMVAGFDDYLTKPLDAPAFLPRVSALLGLA